MVLVRGYLKPPMRGERAHQRGDALGIADGHGEQAVCTESITGRVAELILAVRPMNCETHAMKPATQPHTGRAVPVDPLTRFLRGRHLTPMPVKVSLCVRVWGF